MIHWAWLIVAFFAGMAFGMLAVAFAEVSRQNDNEPKKWWEYDEEKKGE